MPGTKGFLSIPDQIGADFGKALGAELGKAIASFSADLRGSVLHINLDVTVDLQSKQTTAALKTRTARK